jgi:hypothetical protein
MLNSDREAGSIPATGFTVAFFATSYRSNKSITFTLKISSYETLQVYLTGGRLHRRYMVDVLIPAGEPALT